MSDQLREAIRGSGQSLYQLSKTTGVDSGRLSRFMRGERDLTLTAAEKIFRALRLRVVKDPSLPDVREGPPSVPEAAPAKKGRRRKE